MSIRPASYRDHDSDELTPREAQVKTLLLTGVPMKDIAFALHVSPRTVAVHLGHIYRKRGVHGCRELSAKIGQLNAGQ